ncbi:hypothetical protein SCHPADRAFT_892625 [Schizopora paradoxa]|uniref:Uncharacterized protein n=1 Tax=Schizopora paradoxa TaxID=27342 RepID=A0A0H2RZ99_9AGAM|nr:hypothetical protein SCHPADRAFT_892625 [Schizopora paradoxa]
MLKFKRVNVSGRPPKLNAYRSSRIIVRLTGEPLEQDNNTLTNFYITLQQILQMSQLHIRGVEYTRSGNIAISAAEPTTAEQLLTQGDSILHALRRVGAFGGGASLELDGPWSNVVVHKVPLRRLAEMDEEGMLDFEGWEVRFRKQIEELNGVQDMRSSCQRLWVLSREGTLAEMWDKGFRDVSIRMDLSDGGLAEQLKLQGVYIGGVHCRTSQYRARPKSPSS